MRDFNEVLLNMFREQTSIPASYPLKYGWERNREVDFKNQLPYYGDIVESTGKLYDIIFSVFYFFKTIFYEDVLCEDFNYFADCIGEEPSKKFLNNKDYDEKVQNLSVFDDLEDGQKSVLSYYFNKVDFKKDFEIYNTCNYDYSNCLDHNFMFGKIKIDGKYYFFISLHLGDDNRGGYTKWRLFRLKPKDVFDLYSLVASFDIYKDNKKIAYGCYGTSYYINNQYPEIYYTDEYVNDYKLSSKSFLRDYISEYKNDIENYEGIFDFIESKGFKIILTYGEKN